MKRALRPAALLLLALALPACLERKQTGMINPDGSGKIVVDTLVAAPPAMGGTEKPDIGAVGRQFATNLITKSAGVDAWKDVVVETAPDGRAHVAATAYFPDLSKLRLDVAVPIKWTKDAKGNYTLTISRDETAATQPAPKMTDEELAEGVKKARQEYQDNLPIAKMILASLKIEMTYTLPGPVTSTNILTKGDAPNTVTLSIDGKKMLDALDKMMADDKAVEESVRTPKGSQANDDILLEKMFGKKGPISATVAGPGKPLFDYKTEMTAAKAQQADMLKKAGIDATPRQPATPMQPGE